MASSGFNYFLSRVLEPVDPNQGQSGYFSTPTESLDPRLFTDGNPNKFRPEVRNWVLDTLYNFWSGRYNAAPTWSTVWIAGSAISYQWSEARGNGDLDVLIGVSTPKFIAANPQFAGLSPADVAAVINKEFHGELWPQTALVSIGTTGVPDPSGDTDHFEVTFYVNPGAEDIRTIKPYAAFNITTNEWTVHPPEGQDFEHPEEFFTSAGREADRANQIVEEYNTLAQQAKAMQPGSPGWHNAMRQAEIAVSKAAAMYEEIHLGRRQAFGPSGSGYGDYYNFRWQFHKKRGTAQALNGVSKAHRAAQAEFSERAYGRTIDSHDVALRRAALWNRGVRS